MPDTAIHGYTHGALRIRDLKSATGLTTIFSFSSLCGVRFPMEKQRFVKLLICTFFTKRATGPVLWRRQRMAGSCWDLPSSERCFLMADYLMADYLPRLNSEFRAWVTTFVTYANANLVTLRLLGGRPDAGHPGADYLQRGTRRACAGQRLGRRRPRDQGCRQHHARPAHPRPGSPLAGQRQLDRRAWPAALSG